MTPCLKKNAHVAAIGTELASLHEISEILTVTTIIGIVHSYIREVGWERWGVGKRSVEQNPFFEKD